jgi:hypothetical protein
LKSVTSFASGLREIASVLQFSARGTGKISAAQIEVNIAAISIAELKDDRVNEHHRKPRARRFRMHHTVRQSNCDFQSLSLRHQGDRTLEFGYSGNQAGAQVRSRDPRSGLADSSRPLLAGISHVV